ncbi:hypothetical protein EZS27_008172 [termite gut metagenome]|uniref:Uncharacterized protein n=1 Tax=termite gut metagenome TaxID=433724 RepID=A0A5J4SFW7_9ZZZZ
MKSKKTPKISLTSRGSAVRIRQRPLEDQGLTVKCKSFCFIGIHNLHTTFGSP